VTWSFRSHYDPGVD